MKKLLLLGILALSGCAVHDASLMNNIELGMTKQQVTAVLGQPDSTAARGENTLFRYKLIEAVGDGMSGYPYLYFVSFKKGHVDVYGRWGDFNTTHSLTQKWDITTHNR